MKTLGLIFLLFLTVGAMATDQQTVPNGEVGVAEVSASGFVSDRELMEILRAIEQHYQPQMEKLQTALSQKLKDTDEAELQKSVEALKRQITIDQLEAQIALAEKRGQPEHVEELNRILSSLLNPERTIGEMIVPLPEDQVIRSDSVRNGE